MKMRRLIIRITLCHLFLSAAAAAAVSPGRSRGWDFRDDVGWATYCTKAIRRLEEAHQLVDTALHLFTTGGREGSAAAWNSNSTVRQPGCRRRPLAHRLFAQNANEESERERKTSPRWQSSHRLFRHAPLVMFVFPFTFVPKLLGILFYFFPSDMGCRVEFCCSWPLVLIMAINQNHLGEKKRNKSPPRTVSPFPLHTLRSVSIIPP